MSGRRKAFRRADEMNITTVVAPTREIGLTPGTEKEEAPRAELTDAGQSSRAPGWGQEKGRAGIPHGPRRLRSFDGSNAAMSRSLWARFAKSSGSHYFATVASVQLSRSCDVAREGAGKVAGRTAQAWSAAPANSRNWSCILILGPRAPTLVYWLDCNVLAA